MRYLLFNSGSGNIVTWDPANKGTGIILSDGNLTATCSGGYIVASTDIHGVIGTGGLKYQMECHYISGGDFSQGGLFPSTTINFNQSIFATGTGGYSYYGNAGGIIVFNGLNSQLGTGGVSSSNVLGMVLDCNAGTLQYYVDGSTAGTLITGLTGSWYAIMGSFSGGGSTSTANFGATPFSFTIPGTVPWSNL